MKLEKIIEELKEDETNENGEILEIKKDGVLYYDYENMETFYRDEDNCTIDFLVSCMFISDTSIRHGLDKKTISTMLKIAYGDSFADAVTTLNNIIIFSNEKDFEQAIKISCPNENLKVLLREFSYEDMQNACGRVWRRKKIAFVNEELIYDFANNLRDEDETFQESYSRGIYQTLIHEVRHIMMDTNCFLDGKKYPISLTSEENVEEFCRMKYYSLPYEYQLI